MAPHTETNLFSPTKLGDISLGNRMVMAPMTRNRAGEGNVPTALNTEYYRQRATAGLIITEASQVSPAGVGYPGTPGIHSKQQVQGWRNITDTVHQQGGKIFIQLWYCGRISHPSLLEDAQPVAPSAIKPEGQAITYQGPQDYVEPHALEADEITQIVEQYRAAAHNAKAAGFDGIEMHAANGYLIDQFLRDGSNQRTDHYGDSLENRFRFLSQVLDAVFEAWMPAQVGVRISPENSFNSMQDSSPQQTFNFVAQQLSQFGLAYLHVLEGDMASDTRNVDYQQIKQHFNGHYMANCGYTLERAQAAIKNGDADTIAFGVPFLANPDLVERFKTAAPLNKPDMETFYGGDAHGYTDYPILADTLVTA